MARPRDPGFTLVELVIVLVILGVLSAVTVLVFKDITSNGVAQVCDTDRATMRDAISMYTIAYPGDATIDETELVAAGFLKQESTLHDIDVLDSNAIVGVRHCS